MRRSLMLTLTACAAVLMATPRPAAAQKALERLQRSGEVFHEIMTARDGGIPAVILQHAQCVMIVPGYKRVGFGFGGEAGKGVVTCRVGKSWSAPLFISMGGASFGLQIGAQSADLVMLIMNRRGEDSLLKDKITLGGDMAATAGPVGRDADAQTDLRMNAKMLAYSRSKGLFGGITLKGGVIKQDTDSNRWLYRKATAEQILDGKVARPDQSSTLLAELARAR